MDEQQFEKMLKTAAAKLGMTPGELKSTAEKGDVNGILSHLDKKSAEKVKNAMSKADTDNIYKNFDKRSGK